MNESIMAMIREAEFELQLQFPKKLFDFFRKLENPDFRFEGEEWTIPGKPAGLDAAEKNFVIEQSNNFYQQWNLKALIFARNTNNDLLLCLQAKDRKVLKPVFILLQAKNEIRMYNYNPELLLELGPVDYLAHDDFYLKLENEEVLVGNEWSAE